MGEHSCGRFQQPSIPEEGQFLTAVGSEGSGPLQFHFPFDIAINPSNDKLWRTAIIGLSLEL